jgi:hypothetical protein
VKVQIFHFLIEIAEKEEQIIVAPIVTAPSIRIRSTPALVQTNNSVVDSFDCGQVTVWFAQLIPPEKRLPRP